MSLIDKAKKIIDDREKLYGDPATNLGAVAQMWNAYIEVKMARAEREGDSWHLGAHDVCAMMNLLKTARFANNPKHADNPLDAIGYWALTERCGEEQPEQPEPSEPPFKDGDPVSVRATVICVPHPDKSLTLHDAGGIEFYAPRSATRGELLAGADVTVDAVHIGVSDFTHEDHPCARVNVVGGRSQTVARAALTPRVTP